MFDSINVDPALCQAHEKALTLHGLGLEGDEVMEDEEEEVSDMDTDEWEEQQEWELEEEQVVVEEELLCPGGSDQDSQHDTAHDEASEAFPSMTRPAKHSLR